MTAKTNKKLPAIKHGGTIQLSNGEKFTAAQIRKDPAKVMISIIRQQRSLFSKNMDDLIAARAQAEQPDFPMRTWLHNIYLDIILDPFIHGQIYNHRILPVKNKSFKIFNAKKEADEIKTALFQKGWVSQFIEWALESKFFGFSAIYFKEMLFDGKTSWIKTLELLDRKHVHPEAHVFTVYESDLTGIDYLAEPVCNYVVPVGDPCDLGLLNKAATLAILKRHSWQNWDQFEEIFGLPVRIAKTSSQDPRVQAEIEEWLDQMGTAAYGIFPEGTELDIKESKHTDAFKVFDQKRQAANEELAILFSGQTMTSMNGSSRSQGEVHERVKDEITKDDEKFIFNLFNEILIPLLRDKHNWPLDEGDYLVWEQPEDLAALLTIYQGVDGMGFQLDPAQVSEKFGVKIIGLKPKPTMPGLPEDNGKDPKKPGKPGKPGPDEDDEQDDAQLKVSDLVKLHAKLAELYGGKHVL